VNERSPNRTIQDLQLIQYCVPHLNRAEGDETFKEWATFLQKANEMTEEEVRKVKSSAVRKAYERARVRNMPREVKKAYLQDVAKFGGYAHELALVAKETEERVERETRIGMIRSMHYSGISDVQVAAAANISIDELRSILAAPK